jgi:hypothetical protein
MKKKKPIAKPDVRHFTVKHKFKNFTLHVEGKLDGEYVQFLDDEVFVKTVRPLSAEDLHRLDDVRKDKFLLESAPPALGDLLIGLFAPKNRVDAVLGDLAERFAAETKTKGMRRAKLLFWARVTRSVGPLLLVKVRNGGFYAFLVELGRRLVGS